MAHTSSVSDASYEFIGGYPSTATTDQARDDMVCSRRSVSEKEPRSHPENTKPPYWRVPLDKGAIKCW
ncbi:hypothetical protein B2J88_28820 [Rhodococcus sp. SRB_17]|nr:hypothetical protein [Rhodococcus sp. SRB_17]